MPTRWHERVCVCERACARRYDDAVAHYTNALEHRPGWAVAYRHVPAVTGESDRDRDRDRSTVIGTMTARP